MHFKACLCIRRGVKQGDPLSSKIFIAVLHDIMNNLDWRNKRIKINVEFILTYQRFTDYIILFAKTS